MKDILLLAVIITAGCVLCVGGLYLFEIVCVKNSHQMAVDNIQCVVDEHIRINAK